MGLKSTMVRWHVSTIVKKLYKKYGKRFLKDDPVYFAHQYKDPLDQEVVALIASLLSFGNAKVIQNSVGKILNLLGKHPYQAILNFDPKKYRFHHWGHRWLRADDLKRLLIVLKAFLNQHGSIKNLFFKGFHSEDADISSALHFFSQAMKGKTHPFLFPSPLGGSSCKRFNMFLRWMVRPKDGIDLGLWKEISPSKLIIPLDTHIYQFARKFKISRYKNPSWKMAVEVTQFLKALDPNDPVKFDFAICHFGMKKGWN